MKVFVVLCSKGVHSIHSTRLGADLIAEKKGYEVKSYTVKRLRKNNKRS